MPSLSSPLLSLLCPHRRAEKQKWLLQWESNTAVNTGTQSQWAIKCRPQSVHKQRGRSSHRKQRPCSSWRKITWWKKNRRQSCCYNRTTKSYSVSVFSLSLALLRSLTHTHTQSMINWPPVKNRRSGCKQAANHQNYGKSVWLPFHGTKALQAEQHDCGFLHYNYMCFSIF